MKKYSKNEAITEASNFLGEVKKITDKYNMTFNSDTGDVYLSFQSSEKGKHWDNVKIGWDGDGSGLKVKEVIKDKEYFKKQALAKLTDEERELLGL